MSGEVYQMWKREVLLMDDEGNELHLLKSEQIPEGKKRPVKVEVDKTYSMDEVKSTKYVLNFK